MTAEFRPLNKTSGLSFFKQSTSPQIRQQKGGVLDSQGLKRLCQYISLVLWNPKPLLSFLWLSSMVVTLTCLQRTGQLSGSRVYILQLSDHFLKGSVEPFLPRTPLTACCVLPSTAPLETKSVHFACHHYCHFSIGHFIMQGP